MSAFSTCRKGYSRKVAVGRAVCEALEERRLLSAKTIYVDVNSPAPATNGPTWDTAYPDLQTALGVAVSGDTIKVADGTYKPTSGTDRTISFQLKTGVAIYGGYAGYGAGNPDARDVAAYLSILSGDIGVGGDKSDNSYHVVSSNSTDNTAILNGFTITGGNANAVSPNPNFRGGGMTNLSSSPTVINCTFSGNSATYGAGMENGFASPTLINCTFSGNSAGSGGGIYNNASSFPSLTNCTFIRNIAGSGGGGISNGGSSPTLANCTFDGNSADSGGGISNTGGSSPTLTNCTFSGNAAASGGGMSNASSSPTLTNCIFSGNAATGIQALNGGGGMYNNGASSPTLTGCVFDGNTAIAGTGGGMYNNSSSSPKVSNCAFIGNTAGSGGALGNTSSSLPTLINCTIWGSDFILIFNASSTATLTNCIVWGSNTPVLDYGGISTITYSDIQGGYTGNGNINADPLFVRSPWAGADGMFDMANYDVHLREGSPGLDIGSNAAIPTGVTTDMAGDARIQNGTVDLGAYEGSVLAPAPKALYVDPSAPGANTGSSWTDAFTDFQSALRLANDGDTIRVAHGTYKPTTTTDRTISFALRNTVAIYGSYAGYGALNPDARDTVAYPTVLSGDIGTPSDPADNSYHVVIANGVGSSTVLDGVTVTRGYANGTAANQFYGGGLFATGASPMLSNCMFSGNSAGNTYDGHGGGLYSYYSSPSLTNCVFSGNSAFGAQGRGGGVFSYPDSTSPTLTNCTFTANSAGQYGGGIYNAQTLINCIFWGNTAGSNPPVVQMYGSNTMSINHSDVQDGWPGVGVVGLINSNPLFVRAPSAGSDGQWGTDDDDYGDLRLQMGSPCINAGSNAAVPAVVTTDLAGNPRIIDGVVDMGAYEGANAADPNSNHAPTDIALSASSIAEYQPAGTSVGALNITDPDTGDTFTYTLVSGVGSTDNTSFTISGDMLKSNAVFDYTAKHNYSIRVRSTDQGGLWFEKNLTIAVTTVARNTIKGTIFNDMNADGIRAKGEGILKGQKVFLDTNNNGRLDAGEPSQVSSATGAYAFGNLLPGVYHFHAAPGTGWRVGRPIAGYDLTLGTAQVLTGKDFGLTQMALVSGSVFNDANGNKIKATTEAGLAGWTVFVDKNNNGVLDRGELSVKTNAAGNFSVNLAAGGYTLRVVPKTSYKVTTPAGGRLAVKLSAGQMLAGRMFGFKK